ncbi:MAG TPA: molybdenum cofactor biosynthesis protein B [Vicinamibacterales bacterium]|nr:molybdenum cofactor biosynthesis protein B [Vicinamibacterales bacterium]
MSPHGAADAAQVRCFVLTISDTRTEETDTSGRAIAELLASAGHVVDAREIVRDDPQRVREIVAAVAARTTKAVDAIVTTGGTGVTARDSTFEALDALLDKRLDGFGELFRMLSYEQVGAAAMLSRAGAGTIGRTAIFMLPGSEAAVRLAMTDLILPVLRHLTGELHR